MTATEDLLSELASLGTDQARKIYLRHGAHGTVLGVSYAHLDRIAKRLRKSRLPGLAEALWASGVHDARALATKVLTADELSARLVDSWVGDIPSRILAADLTVGLAKSGWEGSKTTAERWLEADPAEDLWRSYCGWFLIASLASEAPTLPDSWFGDFLPRIEAEIGSAPNWIRHAQNNALIAIGSRSEPLRDRATAVAGKIGKVSVDFGDTGCKTPDAGPYIAKVWDHKSRKTGAKSR